MSSKERAVGTALYDEILHYTTDGLSSLCGLKMKDVFRWSQYPRNNGDGCKVCEKL